MMSIINCLRGRRKRLAVLVDGIFDYKVLVVPFYDRDLYPNPESVHAEAVGWGTREALSRLINVIYTSESIEEPKKKRIFSAIEKMLSTSPVTMDGKFSVSFDVDRR